MYCACQWHVKPEDHSMRNSLITYLTTKIPPVVQDRTWSSILVKGAHQRDRGAIVSSNEKSEKRFNKFRPTSIIVSEHALEIACFPGKDYITHYATLIATYLCLTGRNPAVVGIHQPTDKECLDILFGSNLRLMGHVHTVFVGYVEHICDPDTRWDTGSNNVDELFAWSKTLTPNGRTTAYLGCMVSFWGDISGHLVQALRSLNHAESVLYIGKAGSLRAQDVPNHVLATGGSSFLHGKRIFWKNAFDQALNTITSPNLCNGTHVNVKSPLEETASWAHHWKDHADWVDCEVGHMARASELCHISFGYLHVISDNVVCPSTYNLANERETAVIASRKDLFETVKIIVSIFLQQSALQSMPP